MHYFDELAKTIECIDPKSLSPVIKAIIEVRKNKGVVYTAGNGGSAATAMHFTNDLLKLAASRSVDRAVKSVCLSANPAVLTCLANDMGYDESFVYQYEMMATKDADLLFGISCSGGSANVYKLLWIGKAFYRAKTVLLTGNKNGECRKVADYVIKVPHDDIRIQEDVHLAICHMIAGELRDRD